MNREYFRLSEKAFVKDDKGERIADDGENIESKLEAKNINEIPKRRETLPQMQYDDESISQKRAE